MHGRIAAGLTIALLAAVPAAADVPAGNLLVNPGAEAGAGAENLEVVPVPSWQVTPSFTVVKYGAPLFLTVAGSATWGGGVNFFAGGPNNAASAATQTVDVSAAATEIDAGQVTGTLSALLGGYASHRDQASITATAFGAAGNSLGSVGIGPVTVQDRNSATTLLPRTISQVVPPGTRTITVRIDATRFDPSYNDGYVDNASLTLAGPTPTPPPVPLPAPAPAPAQTPVATPTPTFRQTVVVKKVDGTIRVRRPGSSEFTDLDTTQGIPLGSTVDSKKGEVLLTSVPKPGGQPETARFFDGVFVVRQSGGVTELTLSEPLAACQKAGAAAAKPKSRKLWGDGKGSFRTRGQFSSATVRGTKWLVQDSCAGTLTRVSQGAVTVRDNVMHKTIVVRAGGRYLARPNR